MVKRRALFRSSEAAVHWWCAEFRGHGSWPPFISLLYSSLPDQLLPGLILRRLVEVTRTAGTLANLSRQSRCPLPVCCRVEGRPETAEAIYGIRKSSRNYEITSTVSVGAQTNCGGSPRTRCHCWSIDRWSKVLLGLSCEPDQLDCCAAAGRSLSRTRTGILCRRHDGCIHHRLVQETMSTVARDWCGTWGGVVRRMKHCWAAEDSGNRPRLSLHLYALGGGHF
jgi:hypothetical protein